MLTSFLAAIALAGQGTLTEVPSDRYNRLSQGINLSNWWAQTPRDQFDPDRLRNEVQKADFDQLHQLGFTYVRWPVDPRAFWNGQSPVTLDAARLALFKQKVQEAEDSGLAVTVAAFPTSAFKQSVQSNPVAAQSFVDFWHAFAVGLKDLDPSMTFLEIMNEPEAIDDAKWQDLQGRAISEIRQVLPQETLVASGGHVDEIGELLKLTPYSDPNVVYTFHFYDPMVFTLQSQKYAWGPIPKVKNLDYPSDTASVMPNVADLDDEDAKKMVMSFGHDHWDKDRVDTFIKRAADWGLKNHVRVICNEFGANVLAPKQGRTRWIADVAQSLKDNGIGWAMWDYEGAFAAFSGPPGNRKVDSDVLQALGSHS